MSYIIVENLNKIKLTSPDNLTKNVLEIIHSNYIDWKHSCGKKGKCTTCKMQVVEGWENITELTECEVAYKIKCR